MMRGRRPGFTLIEILVAMTVAAVVLLGADLVYEQLAASGHALASAARVDDAARGGEMLLRQLIREVDVSPSDSGTSLRTFGGDAREARFTSWCTRPGGWKAECQVDLRVGSDTTAGGSIVAVTSTGDTAQIRLPSATTVLRYLLDASNGGHWLVSWGHGPTVPQAIGVVSGNDTTVLRIGSRG